MVKIERQRFECDDLFVFWVEFLEDDFWLSERCLPIYTQTWSGPYILPPKTLLDPTREPCLGIWLCSVQFQLLLLHDGQLFASALACNLV